MLAKNPTDHKALTKKMLGKQVLRLGIIAELDAINLYEQLATASTDAKISATFLDIAQEEKTHVGEFLTLLLGADKEQEHEFEAGKREVKERSG